MQHILWQLLTALSTFGVGLLLYLILKLTNLKTCLHLFLLYSPVSALVNLKLYLNANQPIVDFHVGLQLYGWA